MPTPAEQLSATKRRGRKTPLPRVVWDSPLRQAREALGLSLRDVAKSVGISAQALWVIEKGGDPMLTNAVKLAEFFGKPVGELWPRRRQGRQ